MGTPWPLLAGDHELLAPSGGSDARIAPPPPRRRGPPAAARAASALTAARAVAALLALLAAIHPALATPDEKSRPILLLGDRSYPPLSYLEDGEPKGMDIDIARSLASVLGRPIHIELSAWDAAQERVLRGEADGLLSMSISEERLARYDFTDATSRHDFTLFVRRGDVTVSSESLPSGARVGVTPGGYPRVVLLRRPSFDLVLIDDYESGFRSLHEGRLDAVAADSWVGAYIVQSRHFEEITVAGEPFTTALAAIAVRKGNAALVNELNRAIRMRRADGTIPQIKQRWQPQDVLVSRERVRNLVLVVAGVLLLVSLGALVVWVVTLKRQVRARLAVEAALRENDQRLRIALSAADMGTWLWSPATNRTRRDAKLNEMAGLPAIDSEHPFDDLFSRIHPEDREATRIAFERTVRDRQAYSADYRVVLPDGSARWLRALGKAIASESGELAYVTGAVVDITDRKKAEAERDRLEEQIRHSERLQSIGRLAGGVAHDFNNLLTVINGYADLLLGELAEGDPRKGHVQEIRTAGERAAGLTRQLLTFSRKQVSEPVAVHLNALVQESAGMLGRLVTERIEVKTRLEASPDLVLADPGEMHQVLMNLAANARDSMPEGGTLAIETSNREISSGELPLPPGATAGAYVVLTVADSGDGMTPGEIEHLFEPFFTTKGIGKGTGLGLATVHGIVAGSGGFIVVESSPGQGSRFRIHLPVSRDLRARAQDEASPPTAMGRETVLVVEDQEGVRRLAVHCLRASGYSVLEAACGSDALALIERHAGHIDLLLTDVLMPGMSGIELAAEVGRVRPGSRVLYMSGYNEELGPGGSALSAGPACLRKPFGPAALAAAVRAALESPPPASGMHGAHAANEE